MYYQVFWNEEETEMPTHSSIPAWKIPLAEEPGRLYSKGSKRVRHNWTCMTMKKSKVTSIFWFSSVQSLSRVRLFATPWIAAGQASLSITISQSWWTCIYCCSTTPLPTSKKFLSPQKENPKPLSTQTHIHRVGDAIQPSHPLSSPFPPAPNPSQHQHLFQWVNSSHEVNPHK